ncbi:transposase [Streptomyces sp. RKAG293]|uniref:transposase n=1 Tax=Streptomyces sp. RKAG293 TaxID=2893403 RepID=UPI0035A83B05
MAEPARLSGGGGAGGEGLGRSRGGFTTKLHLSGDGRCRPLALVVRPGHRTDCTQFKPVLEKIRVPKLGPGRPRKKPDSVAAGKAYSNGLCRDYLRQRGIRHTIPEKAGSRSGPERGSAALRRRCSVGASMSKPVPLHGGTGFWSVGTNRYEYSVSGRWFTDSMCSRPTVPTVGRR